MSYALDMIGDRWTLHIVRELSFGARRFTDIHKGLPGLATNLLSKRLKELEASSLIIKKILPPPISVSVYELTELGNSLKPIISALSKWGMPFLQVPIPDGDFLGIVPAMHSLIDYYDFDSAPDTTVTVGFYVGNEVFSARMRKGDLSVQFGQIENPDVAIQLSNLETLVALVKRITSIDRALSSGNIEILSGDIVALQAFVDSYPTVRNDGV